MMGDPRVLSKASDGQAGIVSKIQLENFMCHSNLEIHLGDSVNFITGQNGSGKSAILTALCVAFGCRAKGTQRASTLKDFIKTGCSSALVRVEIKNQGEDAFKPNTYGDVIIVERRISDSTSSTILKDHQGRKVASRREDLHEIVEHFNIDVENPCVIMSQDKSREFLHSGNDKDKFKFFFKATLLYQVDDRLKGIRSQLNAATEIVAQLEKSIAPVIKELDELQGKIKSMEHVEEISQQVQLLKKKLAWAWVYDVDKQLEQGSARIEKLKNRIPACQDRIDRQLVKIEELGDLLNKKKAQIACMMEKTSEVRRTKDELQQSLSLATKERLELEEEYGRRTHHLQKMVKRVNWLQQQIHEVHEQNIKNTQAEENEMEEKLKELRDEVAEANLLFQRFMEEEDALSERLTTAQDELKKIASEIEDSEKKNREIRSYIRELQLHQTNKVTAFGGARVTNLLQAIERHHHRFKRPPIGPIGSHVVSRRKYPVCIHAWASMKLNELLIVTYRFSFYLQKLID